MGKTPDAATECPSPKPPTLSHARGSIPDSGGRLPLSMSFASIAGERPETFTRVEESVPHPGISRGTFIIPIRYFAGLMNR